MNTEKKTLHEEVTDTLACAAYAEVGEPCPIDTGKQEEKIVADEGRELLNKVEDTMACAAYAEAGEPCPIAS